MCSSIPAKVSSEAILALYNTTCAEITRYRNYEWRNQGVFSASLLALIAFGLTHRTEIHAHKSWFEILLYALAIGNIFYTSIAHWKLTVQRNIQVRLNSLINLFDLQVGGEPVLPPKWNRASKSFHSGWCRGVLDHLLPFFLLNAFLVYIGVQLIHDP